MEPKQLEQLIGLSNQDCNCTAAVPAIDAKASQSGLYIAETEGLSLNLADAGRDCGVGSVWDMLNTARRNAAQHLLADTLQRFEDVYQAAREPFVGTLGTLAYRGRLDEGEEGFTVKRANLPGTTFTVDKVGAVVNYDGEVRISFPVVVQDPQTGIDTPDICSVLVVCAAYTPTLQMLPQAVRVPMNGEPFTVTVELADDGQALANSIPCGCGLKDVILGRYFLDWPSSAGGAILDGSITCDPTAIIANNLKLKPNVAKVVAFALQYKAAELAIEAILASGEINRFTMLSRERLWGKRDHYRLEYTTRLEHLSGSNGYDVKLGSCYKCKEDQENGLRRGKILV